jgi:PAS domain S-box-containing protein
MQVTSETLDKLDQQTENSLRRLNDLCQRTDTLPTLHKQPLKEALEDHQLTLQELQVAVEELRQQNEELAATRQEVEAERQRYQDLFEFAPDGYLVTDPDAVILEANQAAADLLKCSKKRLVGKPLVVFVTCENLRKFHTKLSQLPSAKKAKEWEVQIQPRQGASFSAAFKVAVVRNSDERVVGLRWLLQDITERKQYEADLESAESNLEKQVEERTSELSKTTEQLKQEIAARQRTEAGLRQQTEWKRLMEAIAQRICQPLNLEQILNPTVAEVRQFFQSDRVVIYRVESSGAVSVVAESVAPACTSLLGIASDAPLVREIALDRQGNTCVIHDTQEGLPTAINEFLQQQQVKASLSVPIRHGNQFWGLLAIHQCSKARYWQQLEISLLDQLATHVSIAIQQTDYRQMLQLNTNLERQVQERTEQTQVNELERLNRLKDDFLHTVSHELRTPLANMKMAIQMLGLTLNQDQPLFTELTKPAAEQSKIARYFQILHNQCNRELSLITDLLDLQSLYAGVKPLLLTSIRLQDWLPQIVEPFQQQTRNHQQSLRIDISPEVPPFICDPESLGRVLAELLENACKYTPPGEQILVTAQAQSQMMYLSVNNSGVEIPASELSCIFDKFYRIPKTDLWKQGGTGLGLALVQQLVAHLGGTIRVESAIEQTRFILQLPLDKTR